MKPATCKPFSLSSMIRFDYLNYLFTAILLYGFLALTVQAEVPGIIGYQGHVSVNGVPFNGTGYFKFALVKPSTPPLVITLWSNNGTSTLGGEPTQAVSLNVTKGLYSLGLGDTTLANMTTAITPTVLNSPEIYLRVWFSSNGSAFEPLSPDTRILPVAFAQKSANADYAIYAATADSLGTPSGFETVTIHLPNLPVGAKPLEMVWIAPGVFRMGSPDTESNRFANEGPQHTVWISQGFYLGIYEVTQAQWQTVMRSNPAHDLGVGNDYPVYYVSWNDCQSFISKLNQMNQVTFRLPTEAEWEYACRAGTATRFYWGDDLSYTEIGKYAWYNGNSSGSSHPVGEKMPNAWGLFDMSGNVWEWCQDYYLDTYLSQNQKDPTGPQTGLSRILRSGNWNISGIFCRSARRDWGSPGNNCAYCGFRLVMNK